MTYMTYSVVVQASKGAWTYRQTTSPPFQLATQDNTSSSGQAADGACGLAGFFFYIKSFFFSPNALFYMIYDTVHQSGGFLSGRCFFDLLSLCSKLQVTLVVRDSYSLKCRRLQFDLHERYKQRSPLWFMVFICCQTFWKSVDISPWVGKSYCQGHCCFSHCHPGCLNL